MKKKFGQGNFVAKFCCQKFWSKKIGQRNVGPWKVLVSKTFAIKQYDKYLFDEFKKEQDLVLKWSA